MRFTIVRDELVKSVNVAFRAISNKVSYPVLENLKLDLTDDGLSIIGSNFEISIKTLIPYVDGEKEIIRNYKKGSALVKGKLFADIIRSMDDEEITFDVIDNNASITDNHSEYRLNCIRPEEYPDLDLEAIGTELVLPREIFHSICEQTAFAASTKEQRPVLTALNLEAANGVLTATATDSARMARKTINIPEEINFVANVPAKMMVEVDHLLENLPDVSISFSDKKALFKLGKTVVATRLIAGDYPNTKNIVPKLTNFALEVNGADLLKAIARANLLSMDRENVVDLAMSDEGVSISAKSSQVGSAIEKIDNYKFDGSQLKVSFNSEFVSSAIRALNAEDVTIAFVGEMKPFVIKNTSDDSIIQVVTPVRTY